MTPMLRSRLLLPFVITALGPGCAPPDVGVAEVSDALVDRRGFEASEGVDPEALAHVDNGDGTWSYALPRGFDPARKLRGDIVTWRYAGQARYAYEPKMGGTRRFVVHDEPALDADARRARLTRVDRLGRIWKAGDVDRPALATALAPHPAEADHGAPRAAVTRAEEPALPPGTVVEWTPMSWSSFDCQPGGGVFLGNELHLWDGDSRNLVTSPIDREKTAVRIRVDGVTVCSGVLVRQNQVLTAGHCVADSNSNPIVSNRVSVCRNDIAQCLDASDVDFLDAYHMNDLDTDFDDDWSIIELTGTWSATAQTMILSSADDDRLRALDVVRNLAFPQFAPQCTENPNRLFQNTEHEPIANVAGDTITLKIDGSPGHSGSPLYYCPEGSDDNTCEVGETAFVIGVFSGWNSVSDRFVAPKVAHFRDDALIFIND